MTTIDIYTKRHRIEATMGSNAIQDNIKRQLQAKNMTAAELERRTGIPHAVVNILHGRSKNPSIRTAQAIAKELGCSIEELFGADYVPLTPSNDSFNMPLYNAAFQALCAHIQTNAIQPTPELMAQWLSDIYKYSLGTKDGLVDKRFIQWLLER